MYTPTKEKLLKFLKDNGEMSPHSLSSALGIGKVALHRHIKKLLESGQLVKIGTPPRVTYKLANIADDSNDVDGATTRSKKALKLFNELKINKYVFWDVKPENLNIERNKDFVIARTLDVGNMGDVKKLFMIYSRKEMKDVLLRSRILSKITRSFVNKFFNIKDKDLLWNKNFSLPIQERLWNY